MEETSQITASIDLKLLDYVPILLNALIEKGHLFSACFVVIVVVSFFSKNVRGVFSDFFNNIFNFFRAFVGGLNFMLNFEHNNKLIITLTQEKTQYQAELIFEREEHKKLKKAYEDLKKEFDTLKGKVAILEDIIKKTIEKK